MDDEKLQHLRHSLAHLLAAAVLELWPDTKQAIGPAIENGFYYDFDFSSPISDGDLPKIEQKMREILPTWKKFERIETAPEKIKEQFKNNPYKLELVDEFLKKGEQLSLYKSGEYTDLCRGGHVDNPQNINPDAFKLTHLAGAYWRGDEKNKMLTRIYGAAFESKKELSNYIARIEEAKKRDHKKIGKELDLFLFSDLVGGGLPLWTPKGTIMRNILDDFVWQLRKARGYEKVEIPHITKKDLYEISGHWEKFQNELFKITTREGHLFAMKPMNCPHHSQIYARKLHSYRELPKRYANTTMVYRDEQTGELSGLSRVRSITQDDAHVFCRYSQVKEEATKIWDIVNEFYTPVGFDLRIRLSMHDPKNMGAYLGTTDVWDKAITVLREVVKSKGATAHEAPGEAAFYGPKIDFLANDSLGREWQLATIQVDMNLPERFDLVCINEKGERERIVMIHAAIMGAIERYISILIEHFAGAFPLWLSPVQVSVITVSENHLEYAKNLVEKWQKEEIRAELDGSNETVGKKIREAELRKTPYVAVVGDKEIQSGKLAIRKRGSKDLEELKPEEFISKLKEKIEDKILDL